MLTAVSAPPASAIVLPSGMTLGGQVEPGNVSAVVKSVSFSGHVATGKVNTSTTGGMLREWNLCQKACSEPVVQPMSR